MRRIRWKIIAPLLIVFAIYIGITTPVGEYADAMADAYRSEGFTGEGWWRMRRATRWYAGRFRSYPDDGELIEHLNENRAGFDALVASYYEAMRIPGSEPSHNEILIQERTELGIDSFGIAGPALFRNTNSGTYFNFGISFSLIDSGPTPWWSLGRRTYKEYLYVPQSPPLGERAMTPLDNLLATGEYSLEKSADPRLRSGHWPPCSLRQIDQNWFIARCIKHWD